MYAVCCIQWSVWGGWHCWSKNCYWCWSLPFQPAWQHIFLLSTSTYISTIETVNYLHFYIIGLQSPVYSLQHHKSLIFTFNIYIFLSISVTRSFILLHFRRQQSVIVFMQVQTPPEEFITRRSCLFSPSLPNLGLGRPLVQSTCNKCFLFPEYLLQHCSGGNISDDLQLLWWWLWGLVWGLAWGLVWGHEELLWGQMMRWWGGAQARTDWVVPAPWCPSVSRAVRDRGTDNPSVCRPQSSVRTRAQSTQSQSHHS